MRAREFTEPRAAGCIIVAEDTGRWCLQQRSEHVSDPGVWSTWGGGVEPGESLEQCVRRELEEEGGYTGPLKLEPLLMNQRYATYIGHVPHEFEPRLNSESQDSCWVEAGDWPRPLHPGLARALDKISNGLTEAQSAKTGIYQTDVLGAKAYHAKCMEPNCNWESKRFDKIKQAQAAAEKHAKSHFKQGVAEGAMKDLHIDLQDQQWDAIVGYVINGLKKNMDIGRIELNLYKYAGQEMFDVDQELQDRGFKDIADLADHIRQHNGRYVPPTDFNLGKGVAEGLLAEASSDEAWELVGQPVPEIQQFVKQMGYGNDEQSVAKITAIIDVVPSTQIPATSIPKLKNLANKGSDIQTLKAVQQISGRPDAEQQYTKLMQARDAGEGRRRDVSGYLQYVKSGNYDPPVLLKLPSGVYVIGGRTRLYAALALGVPANVKIISADNFRQSMDENFADGKVQGKSRPGRVKRAGASCAGSVTDLRARAKKYGGERGRMYHWCANMKAGRKK